MAWKIRKVDYFKMETSNRPGEGANVLSIFRAAKVNMLVFTGFPSGRRAQIDFIPENTAAFKAAAEKVGLKLLLKKGGFLVQGDDRVGAVADILKLLANARINVTAIDAICAGKGRFGAILWVKQEDVTRAARVLKAK